MCQCVIYSYIWPIFTRDLIYPLWSHPKALVEQGIFLERCGHVGVGQYLAATGAIQRSGHPGTRGSYKGTIGYRRAVDNSFVF